MLGFSAFSFVSVAPVHPISGLAAVGGLLGSVLALPLVVGALAPERDRWGPFGTPGAIRSESTVALVVVSYGTLLAFLYPTVFRLGGLVVGDEQWVFGPVSRIGGGVPSFAVFIAGTGAASLLLVGAYLYRHTDRGPSGRLLVASVAAHVPYAALVLAATAVASDLWYPLVPSV